MNQRLILSITIFCAALALQVPSVTAAQPPVDVEREISRLDSQRLEALTRGDASALEQLLSPDLVYTHASGWRQTKAEFLASIRSGELKYHAFSLQGVRMREYGNTVIATGEASAQVRAKGRELDVKLLFLEAYVKQKGRWQLAAWQSTRYSP